MDEALVIKNLNAGYGKVPGLVNASLIVQKNEVVAIIGPNGAGKSTLLKTISGLVTPFSGEILFNGKNVHGMEAHHIARLGISHVREGGRTFPNLTILDNLLMGAVSNREMLKEGVLDEVFSLFPVLSSRLKQLAGTLSGGERQMLAIGSKLMSRPSFLMLDEPSLGMAPKLIDNIYEKIRILKKNSMTILIVEQNTSYVLKLATRAYVLENGRIVLSGTGEELLRSDHIKSHYLGV